MTFRSKTILTIGAAVLATGLFGAAAVAAAQPASTNGVEPAIRHSGTAFYTQDQIQDAWRAATASFDEPLPDGVAFPSTMPPIVTDDPDNTYEVGFPESIAARYWRCAWVDTALRPARAGDTGRAAAAIKEWDQLPAIRNNPDFDGYDQSMDELAKQMNVSPLQAEFEVDCGPAIYTKETAR